MGRPKASKIDFFVSLVAVAFVDATDQSYRRVWDIDNELPFQNILSTLFQSLGLKYSVETAVRRQRDRIKK